jgi:hypothetical protein
MEIQPAEVSFEQDVLLKIQNNKKPDQVINLVFNREQSTFETRGLSDLFRVKEIRIGTTDVLDSLPEYAMVLSYLLEAMSAAQDFNLPFMYNKEFTFQGNKYTLGEEGNYRILLRG